MTPEEFAALKEKLARQKRMAAFERQKAAGEFDTKYSAASDSDMENFVAGVGSGLVGLGDRAVNLVLPKSLEKGRFTSEAIAERKKLEEDLLNTKAGMAGKIAGEVAATAPLGGAISGTARLAAGATKVPQLVRAAAALSKPTGYASRAAAGALEGAAQSALTGEDAGTDAAIGGGLGAGFGTVGKAVGQVARAVRPKISDVAQETMRKTGVFIPAHQALPEGSIGKSLWSDIAGNLPGSQGALRRQHEDAIGGVRNLITEKALPAGVSKVAAFQPGDRMKDVAVNLEKHWNEAYDGIYKQTIPNVRIPPRVADAINKIETKGTKLGGTPVKTGGDLSGREALDLSRSIQDLIDGTNGIRLTNSAKRNLIQVRDNLDKHIMTSLPSPLRRKMISNKERYKTYLAVKSSIDRSGRGGEFSLSGVSNALVKKKSRLADTALDAEEALRGNPSKPNIFKTYAAMAALGSAGFLGSKATGDDATLGDRALGAAAFMGGAAALPRLLASKQGQKILNQYGDTGLLDKYAKGLRQAGSVGRRVATSGANLFRDEEE